MIERLLNPARVRASGSRPPSPWLRKASPSSRRRCLRDVQNAVRAVLPDLSRHGDHASQLCVSAAAGVGGGGGTCVCVAVHTHTHTHAQPSLFLLLAAKSPDQPLDIVYVPSHLYHMLFELFKVRIPRRLRKRTPILATCAHLLPLCTFSGRTP